MLLVTHALNALSNIDSEEVLELLCLREKFCEPVAVGIKVNWAQVCESEAARAVQDIGEVLSVQVEYLLDHIFYN